LTAYLGLLIAVEFSILWTAAVIVNGDWQLGRDTLSELGGNVPSRWVFNIAVLIAGFAGIRFSFGLARLLADRKLGRTGSYVFAVASLGLISVGVFPIDTGTPHTVASIFFFTVAALAAIILLYPLSKQFGIKSAPFITTAAVIVVSFLALATTPIPFAEAVTVAGLLVWAAVLSVQILYDLRKTNTAASISEPQRS
ncbi:MAG: DUF998 domain-containing protein, partial [Thermoplasmata archaeon]